jgi:ABC-2 type transport system permease protein
MASPARAELTKVTTTRGAIGMIGGAAVASGLVAAASVLSLPVGALGSDYHTQQFFLLGAIVLTVFAAIVGARMFTDEHQHGLVVASVIVVPERVRLFLAKATAAAIVAATLSIIGQLAMLAATVALAAQKGATVALTGADAAAAAGLLLACVLWAVIGVGLGAAVRYAVPAIVGAVAWIVIFENAAIGFLGDAGRLLPGQAGHAVALVSRAEGLLSPVAGGLVLAGYALAVAAAGLALFRRRDVAAG